MLWLTCLDAGLQKHLLILLDILIPCPAALIKHFGSILNHQSQNGSRMTIRSGFPAPVGLLFSFSCLGAEVSLGKAGGPSRALPFVAVLPNLLRSPPVERQDVSVSLALYANWFWGEPIRQFNLGDHPLGLPLTVKGNSIKSPEVWLTAPQLNMFTSCL